MIMTLEAGDDSDTVAVFLVEVEAGRVARYIPFDMATCTGCITANVQEGPKILDGDDANDAVDLVVNTASNGIPPSLSPVLLSGCYATIANSEKVLVESLCL